MGSNYGDFNNLEFDNLDKLSSWVGSTQGELDSAIENLEDGEFDVGRMLDAQTKMNAFAQSVEATTDVFSALHSAAKAVIGNMNR